MIDLKQCPFCGGEAQLGHTDRTSEYGETSFVFCKKCSASGKVIRKSFKYSSDERAIEAWNRRTEEHGNELNIRDVHGRSNIPAV